MTQTCCGRSSGGTGGVYALMAARGRAVAGAGIFWSVFATARNRLMAGDVSMYVAALGAAGAVLAGTVGNTAMAYQAVLTFRSYPDIVQQGSDLALTLTGRRR